MRTADRWRRGALPTVRAARAAMSRTALALAVLALTVLALTACERPAEDMELPAELSELGGRTSAPTYPVERRDLSVEIERSARVQSVRLQELYFQESGRLAELNVGTGDRVTAGQILARLASGAIRHSLRLAELDLEIDRLQATSQGRDRRAWTAAYAGWRWPSARRRPTSCAGGWKRTPFARRTTG